VYAPFAWRRFLPNQELTYLSQILGCKKCDMTNGIYSMLGAAAINQHSGSTASDYFNLIGNFQKAIEI
jgi:hypothetical protein